MPTYDYVCSECGHTFEKFQSIKAPAIRKCPECGKLKVRRIIGTGGGVIFKGSGFYQTDYRSDSYSKKAKEDKATSAGKKESTAKAGESTGSGSGKNGSSDKKKTETGGKN